MVCREERKRTSVAQPDGTGVLLAGAESPTALGATGSAPPPSDSAGPGPGRPRRARGAGAPRSTSNHCSKSLCPSAPRPWPGEPGGPPPTAGQARASEKGEQPVPAPGPLPAGLRRSPGSPQSRTRSDAAGMSTDPARSPDRRVRAGEKESKLKCVRWVCLANRNSGAWQSPSQLSEPCGDRRLSVGTGTGGICNTGCNTGCAPTF
ncbi:translation initiation factor IF-2-like [Vidua macroura]|uniref:translation initiation factor IF-2-like n=1 Tax=Vidua macroura TaxID=187451 RepID=UPI0023A85C3D|nr:translation initiation factor IF-2-like [Vidua macroura]